MHSTHLVATAITAIQAGAEYLGIEAAGQAGGPAYRIRTMLDTLMFWVRTHPLHLALGVVGIVLLRRVVFRAPRF